MKIFTYYKKIALFLSVGMLCITSCSKDLFSHDDLETLSGNETGDLFKIDLSLLDNLKNDTTFIEIMDIYGFDNWHNKFKELTNNSGIDSTNEKTFFSYLDSIKKIINPKISILDSRYNCNTMNYVIYEHNNVPKYNDTKGRTRTVYGTYYWYTRIYYSLRQSIQNEYSKRFEESSCETCIIKGVYKDATDNDYKYTVDRLQWYCDGSDGVIAVFFRKLRLATNELMTPRCKV